MRALIIVLVVIVAACSPAPASTPLVAEDTTRRDALETAVRQAEDGGSIDLRTVLGADWDRAVFMGPYSDSSVARDLLGFDFDLSSASPWLNSEGGMVIVLARGSEAVAWFTVPSATVGLHCLGDAVIPPDKATLTVGVDTHGFRELADPAYPDCLDGAPAVTASPSPTLLPAPAGVLADFDARFAAAADVAAKVPLDGLPPSSAITPECRGTNEPGSTFRVCGAFLPADNPALTIVVMSAGSMGGTLAMVALEMPDGIEGTVLPAPAIGDVAWLSRSWGDRGCTANLAVRDGTLVVGVQVRLAVGATSADCGLDVPAHYLETVARGLLDEMAAFRTIGLPVDDPAERDRAVTLIKNGTLRPGERDIVTLPPELANLSDSGEVVAKHDGDEWTIVFFEALGVVDNYSGWVYRSSGVLGRDEDPLGGQLVTLERIDEHWFHVEAT